MPSLKELRRERVRCIAAQCQLREQQRRIDIFVEEALDRVHIIFSGTETFEHAREFALIVQIQPKRSSLLCISLQMLV